VTVAGDGFVDAETGGLAERAESIAATGGRAFRPPGLGEINAWLLAGVATSAMKAAAACAVKGRN